MGLFKSREDKEIEKKILLNKVLSKMNKFVEKLEVEKNEYLTLAKDAMRSGMTSQLNLTVTGLKVTMTQQRRANEMLLNFKVLSQMRNTSAMTQDFLKGMSILSKEIVDMSGLKEFDKLQANFEKAVGISRAQSDRLDDFLSASQEGFSSAASVDASGESNEDIINMIKGLIVQEENSVDISELDAELDKIEKELV